MTTVNDPVATPGAPQPTLSVWSRAVAVFARPAEAWIGLERRAQWWFPLLVAVLVSVAGTLVVYQRAIVPSQLEQFERQVEAGQLPAEAMVRIEEQVASPVSMGFALGAIVVAVPVMTCVFALLPWISAGFLLGRRGAAKSPLALSPLIKIGDVVIGVDKLEHMFGMGQRYFKGHYLDGKPLVSVLKGGIFKEKTFLGGNMLATGVFSYADLSANFNGMRFWNHMLQKKDDVLGAQHNAGPYLTCQAGKWTANAERPIDLRTYVDATMQESINCSKFATAAGARKFHEGLASMQAKSGARIFSCPENPGLLDDTARKYEVEVAGDNSGHTLDHWFINREGNGRVSYFNEF